MREDEVNEEEDVGDDGGGLCDGEVVCWVSPRRRRHTQEVSDDGVGVGDVIRPEGLPVEGQEEGLHPLEVRHRPRLRP